MSFIDRLWALSLLDIDWVFLFANAKIRFILFRNNFDKNNAEVTDMSVSSTMGNFDQKQGQEMNKYTSGIFVGRKGER